MSSESGPVIYWFRQDLRLADLPGLAAAAAEGGIIPCYVHDDQSPGEWSSGGASRWWLHHSLAALDEDLRERGSKLLILRGNSVEAIDELAHKTNATAVHCSRHFEPWNRELEQRLQRKLEDRGATLKSHPGVLLHDPDTLKTQAGGNFKVFTAFWKTARRHIQVGPPVSSPGPDAFKGHDIQGETLESLELLPQSPNWAAHWPELWQPGSAGAALRLKGFLKSALDNYDEGRDIPGTPGTSRMSPHLHFGEVSPADVWRAVTATAPPDSESAQRYLSELGWREFNHYLMYHYPHIDRQAFQPRFGEFPWLAQDEHFQRWTRGQTGYPLVDAGMRELWHTGYMHNRVRMVCASFLTKHLLLPWQWGARWFWDTLVDADLANNSCGWQWTAGCGADAAPYFRIFNPVLQGEKFDPKGVYTRHWVPELGEVPDRYLHAPWNAPEAIRNSLTFRLGEDYPEPIVDHKAARETALAAYKQLA